MTTASIVPTLPKPTNLPIPSVLPISDGHRKSLLRPVAPPAGLVQSMERIAGAPMSLVAMFKGHGFVVMVSADTTQHGVLLHASISHKHRYPTWEEIKSLRDLVFSPSRDVMMVLPKSGDYVNVHPNCFHLWETPESWDVL